MIAFSNERENRPVELGRFILNCISAKDLDQFMTPYLSMDTVNICYIKFKHLSVVIREKRKQAYLTSDPM